MRFLIIGVGFTNSNTFGNVFNYFCVIPASLNFYGSFHVTNDKDLHSRVARAESRGLEYNEF